MIQTTQKHWFNRLGTPPARLLMRLGIHPNSLTLLGLGGCAAACWYLLATRNLAVFVWLCLACGLIDVLDGSLARVSGTTSKFGGYLDAMTDRYFETMVAVSVAVVTGYWFWSVAALSGSLITSYAKARAGLEVSVSNVEWPDLIERTERATIYLLGLGLSQWWPVRPGGHDLFYWALVGLAVGTHLTALQRMARARRLIAERSRP